MMDFYKDRYYVVLDDGYSDEPQFEDVPKEAYDNFSKGLTYEWWRYIGGPRKDGRGWGILEIIKPMTEEDNIDPD
jgi:hypothetical protein